MYITESLCCTPETQCCKSSILQLKKKRIMKMMLEILMHLSEVVGKTLPVCTTELFLGKTLPPAFNFSNLKNIKKEEGELWHCLRKEEIIMEVIK